jgi:hypothetical protein
LEANFIRKPSTAAENIFDMCERLKNFLFMFSNILLSQVLSFLQDAPPCELGNVAQQTRITLPLGTS